MAREKNLHNMTLDGGWLCLDFVNTIHHRFVPDPHDYLNTFNDLLLWSKKTNILDHNQATSLGNLADKARSKEILKKTIELRETLYQIFRPVANQQVPDTKTIQKFNEYLSPALSGLSIYFKSPYAVYAQQGKVLDLENPLQQIITSAYDLLLSGKLSRVKECSACGWLFLDKSKNNSKRWCNMQTCGSAAKAKRYYRKKKAEGI